MFWHGKDPIPHCFCDDSRSEDRAAVGPAGVGKTADRLCQSCSTDRVTLPVAGPAGAGGRSSDGHEDHGRAGWGTGETHRRAASLRDSRVCGDESGRRGEEIPDLVGSVLCIERLSCRPDDDGLGAVLSSSDEFSGLRVAPEPISDKNWAVDPSDIFVVALLALLGVVLGAGLGMVILVRRHLRSHRHREQLLAAEQEAWVQQLSRFTFMPYHPIQACRPARWLAIRTRDLQAVQLALGLSDPHPCSWSEGLLSARKLFIAPPINGWTLVFGAGLPIPDDDVDVCYRFLRELSRKLGHVQFFQADQVLQHHAWVQVESGRVRRAYAWAGTTVWNQGVKTSAETELRLNCFGYGENPGSDDWTMADHLVANVEKVPQLAQ